MDKKRVAVLLVSHGHSRPVVYLFYSPVTPDGFFLISASKDSSPMLRNGETGDWIRTFEGHKGAVWSCCLDTNALCAATASADFSTYGLVKSYDMPCTVELASLEPKYGNKFVVRGEDMWVHVFDFHMGNVTACNKGHHGPFHCVRFSPGGESYALGYEDGTIRIWQTGPLTHDESEFLSANGSIEKVTVTADEVARKIEGFRVADEGKSKERNR